MVNDDEVVHIKHLYAHKNIQQFKDDIDFLLKKYSPISLLELLTFIKYGRSLPKKAFLLTFDDGFREMHDIVAPILLEKGIPATFFLNSDFIDNRKLFYQHKASILAEYCQGSLSINSIKKIKEILLKNNFEFKDIVSGVLSIKYEQKDIMDKIAGLINVDLNEYLLRYKPYLRTEQIKGLINNGFTIGAHSIDHPLYSTLSLEDQLNQTVESMKHVRQQFSLNYGAFAFPHSDHNVSKQYFDKIYDSGLVDISFGTGGIVNDSIPYNLQRISMEKPLLPAKQIVSYQYARKLFRQITGNGQILR
jgi:peptidoglycan/xylan/chitin deacetylase (PgdA/CDA1 family)